jgi:hypothetical protein
MLLFVRFIYLAKRRDSAAVSEDPESPIVKGSTIERPKVIYNAKTGKFVMYFHLELKGQGYDAAHAAVAVSDHVTGPYKLVKNGRVNAGKWPMNMMETERNSPVKSTDFKEWWTPEWMAAIKGGCSFAVISRADKCPAI